MRGPNWAGRYRLRLVVALVVLAAGANGGYTVQKSMNQCAGYCKGTSKFNYEPGTIYHYDYEVDVSSSIEGATGPGDKPSQMMMRATAVLAALDSPCDLTLTLKDVKLLGRDEDASAGGDTEEFSAALQKNPLRFSLQHGRVEELCALPGELPWVLNVKRGLLSGLQNSMDDLKVSQTVYETDITGSCETRYTAFDDMWWEEELWGGGGRGRRGKGATPMTTIRRMKDLSTCSERNTYFLSLQANPTGRGKAGHMLRSTHECEQSVSEEPEKNSRRGLQASEEEEEFAAVGGVLLRSECRERHLFEPFSYRDSGATTNVTTRLVLRNKEPAPTSKNNASQATARGLSRQGTVVPYTYSTLLYDHSADSFVGTPPEDIGGVGAVDNAVGAIGALEAATQNGVTGEAPTSFAALIAALRRLSHSQLMVLFKTAGKGRTRKFLLDAMPVVATAASMSAFRDLYRSGDVSEAEMDSWMGGLAFLKRPTLAMIAAVTPLLEGDPRPNSVLGVTALVHSYCRYAGGNKQSTAAPPDSSEEGNYTSSEEDESTSGDNAVSEGSCRNKPEVQTVITRLEDMLGKHGCRFGSGQKEEKRAAEAFLALKGLGNAGVAPSPTAADSLVFCYKDQESSNDLRLAAIEVLRRVPCDASLPLRSHLLDAYANVSAGPKETELRIAAYMAVMHCPSLEVMRRIEDTLKREEVNQVGSFVWTHLTNLRSNPSTSSEPYSGALSDLLASKALRRKFRSDARRFSRHYRISTGDAIEPKGAGDWNGAFGGGGGISALGAGADAESSVVLSPESYIPRSASLNLTVRLFGAEVDLLDIGARAEGLEPLVESIFGPGGASSDDVVSRKSRGKKDETPEGNTISRIAESFRSRSSENGQPAEPKGSGYVRVFGNELSYGRFQGLGEMLATVASRVGSVDAATGRMRGMLRDPVAQLAMALAQQRELEYSRSVAFLDAALVMPTAAGLPLSLVANGTASVALSLSGRMDITARSEGSFEAEGVLAPSAAIMVTGTMSVTASDVTRCGLRLDASLRTNTRAEGRIRYRKGRLVEAKFTAPREAGEEIVAVHSEVYALGPRSGLLEPLSGRAEGREEAESCTPRPVSRAIGSEVCARASYPNATEDDSAPRFPLTGPALVSVTLGRTDDFEDYEFKYEFKDEAREEERGETKGPLTDDEYLEEMRLGGKRFRRYRNLLLQFDTPGSRVDRRIKAALAIEGGIGGASMVQASVATPWTRVLEVTAGLENTASARGVGVTATLGGEEVVTAQAELRSVLRRAGMEGTGSTPSGRYEPSVTVSVRGRTLIVLHGRVDYVQGAKYSGDVLLAGDLIRDPVSISGDLTSDGGRYDLTGSVKSALLEGTVQGNFKRTVGGHKKKGLTEAERDAGKFVNAKATFKYSVRGGEQQTFDVSARYLRNSKGVLAKDSAYLTLLSTQFPDYEIDATWDSSTSEGPYFEGRGRLTIGKDGPRWETRPLLVLRGMDHLAFRFFLACRAKKLHYDLSLKHQITERALIQHAILRMGSNHEMSAYLNATSRNQPTARYTLDSEIRLPRSFRVGQKTSHGPGQRVLAFRASVDEVRRRTFELAGGAEWWWTSVTGVTRAVGTYSDRGNRTNSDRRLEGKVWLVHGREDVDTGAEEPSLDFSLQVTQADRKARLTATTEKPRKYKVDMSYAKTGPGEHTLEGWAELSMGKRYDGKAAISDSDASKRLYLELGLGRRMSLDTKLHLGEGLNGLEVDLYWDKDLDLRLSTGATVEFLGIGNKARQRKRGGKVPETASRGLLGSAWLEYPGRNIRGQGLIMPDEVTADLSWAPERAIALALHTERKEAGANFNLSLQTPFQGIERQSASAEYTWDGERFHGQLDANWKQDLESLSADLTMVLPRDGASPWESDADAELHVKSTIQSIRDARFAVAHRTSPRPLGTNTTAQVVWDGDEAFFANVAWTLARTEKETVLRGGAALRSTGPHIRSFATDLTLSRRGDRDAEIRASLSWKRPFDTKNRAVDLGVVLSGLKSGHGYFNMSAPIGEHEQASATFSYSSDDAGGRSTMASELYLDGERTAVASVEGFFAGGGVANLDGYLETPWFSAVEVAVRHNSRDGEGLRESLMVKYDGKKVAEGDVEAVLRSSRDFVISVSGGVSGTVGSAKVEHGVFPNSVRSLVEVTFGGETSSAVLEARDEEGAAPRGQNWRPRVLHGSVTVTSPRLRSGRLRFALDFVRTGKGNFETAVAAPGISAHHSLNVMDILNWESRLEAYRGWEGHVKLSVVNVTLINSFDGNSFNHFSYTYMRGLEQPVSLSLKVGWGGEGHSPDIAVLGSAEVFLPLVHPLSLNLEIPKADTTEEGITVLRPRVTVTYGEDRKNLTVVSRMERGGPLSSITSDVTMHDCQKMSFGMRYNFYSEKKTVHLFASMDNSERAEVLVTFSFPSSLGANVDVKLSPAGVKDFTVMSLDFDMMATEKTFRLLVATEREEETVDPKLDVLAKIRLENGKYSASLILDAPTKTSCFADMDLTKPSKLAILKIQRNGSDYMVLSGSASMDRDSAKLSADIKSAMEGMEKVSFVGTYDRIDREHHLDATLERDAIKSRLTGKLHIDENLTELQAVLRLPFVGYEYVKADAMFTNSPSPSFLLALQKSRSTLYKMSGNCVAGVGFFNASTSLTTPFEGYEKIDATVSHSADALTGYSNVKLLLDYNGSETSLYCAANSPDRSSLSTNVLILTPFRGFEKIDAALEYNASKRGRLDAKAHVTTLGKTSQIALSGMVERDAKHAEVRVLISSPYLTKDIGSVGIEAEYESKRRGELRINLGSDNASYTASIAAVEGGATAVVTTPVDGYKRLTLTLVKDLSRQTAATLTFAREDDVYKLSGEIESRSNHSATVALEVGTAIVGWEDISVHASYDFPPGKETRAGFEARRNRESTFLIARVTGRLARRAGRASALTRWNFGTPESSEFSVDGIYDMAGTEKSLDLNVKTPFGGYENLEAKARVERETAFALVSTPSVSYQLRSKREGDRAGLISLSKSGSNIFSASFERGREARLMAEVVSSIDGYDGNVTLDAQWNRQMGRGIAISANGKLILEGFGMERASSAVVAIDANQPDGRSTMMLEVSTPLVEVLEKLYLSVDYNGRDFVGAKAKTVLEGYNDLEASALWSTGNPYTLLVSVRRDEDEVVSEVKMEMKHGFLRISTNVTTPFEGFEELDSLWRFQCKSEDVNKWNVEAEIKMSVYGEIMYGLEGYLRTLEKAADTELTIYTLDAGYETIVTKFSYDLVGYGSEGKYVNANSESDGRLLFSGSAALKEESFDLKLNAPFFSSDKIDATATFESWRKSETRVRIGRREGAVSVDFPSNDDGKIKFASNLEGYEILEAKWKLQAEENGVHKLEASAEMGLERNGNVFLRIAPDAKELETEVALKFSEGDEYSVGGRWEVVPDSREFVGRLDVFWADFGKVLVAEVNAEAPRGAFAARVCATSTQWRDGKEATLSVGLEYEETGATAESVLRWGEEDSERVALKGKLEVASLKAVSNLEFTTPFTKPLSVSLDYDFLENSPKKVAASYRYGEISYALKGEITNDYFDFQMTTPFSEYKLLKVKGSRIVNGAYKEASLAYELGEGTMGEMKASVSSESKLLCEVNVFANLQGIHKWSMRGNWSMKDVSHITGDLDVKWGEEGHLVFELEWVPPEKARLEVNLSGWAAPVLVSWKLHGLSGSDQVTKLEVVLQSGMTLERKLRLRAGIYPEQAGQTRFEAELETPGENGNWSTRGTFAKNNDGEATMRATLLRGGATLVDVEGNMHRQPGSHSQISLKGGEAVFEAGYDLRKDQKEAHLLAVYGESHRMEASAKGTVDRNAVRASLLVETNFAGLRKLNVEAELGGKDDEREAALRAEWDSGRVEITGSGAFLESVGIVKGRFSIRTPWRPLERVELEATADVQGPTYGINATIGAAKDYSASFDASLDFPLREGDITVVISRIGVGAPARFHASAVVRPKDLLRIRVETPFLVTVDVSGRRIEDEYDVISDAEWGEGQKMTLRGKIRSQPDDYGFNGELEWNGRRLALDAFTKGGTLSPDSCNIDGGFTLSTPYQQFSHMSMLFSLVKEGSKLLVGRLNMTTPFEALPALSATIALKTEEDQGMVGELTATAERRHMRIGVRIRKDLLGLNTIHLEVDLPFLGKKSPITFECTLRCTRPDWRDVSVELKVVLSKAAYGAGVAYAVDSYGVNVSSAINSPQLNFKGGLSGRYENYSLRALGYFNENDMEMGYRLDKATKDYVGNVSLTAPSLGFPDTAVTVTASILPDIKLFLTYKYGENDGNVNVILSGQGLMTNLFLPPLLTSQASLKLTVVKLNRGYDAKMGFSYGESSHSMNLSIESYENILIKGKVLSTHLGERDIDLFLRKDKKIGQAKVSGLAGLSWNASQQSAVIFSWMWKGTEHNGKIELRTVGRYLAVVELSSPWLPNGGVNASGSYSNEIDSLKAEIKCETKKEINSVSLQVNESEGKKTIRGEIKRQSETVAELDTSLLVGTGILDGSARLYYGKSSHQANINLRSNPITMEIKIDSDYLKKNSPKALSLAAVIDTVAMKGNLHITTPFSFLESANLTASSKFSNNGHINVEMTISAVRSSNGTPAHRITIATLKVPYIDSGGKHVKQYMLELTTAPGNNRFISSLNYEFGKLSGFVDALLQLDVESKRGVEPIYYEFRAYGKGSVEEMSAETSGLLVWGGEKYGEIQLGAGTDEERDVFGISCQVIIRGNDSYVGYVELGEGTGKIDFGWPKNQTVNIEFEHEIESWEAFRGGLAMKTPFEIMNDVSLKLKSVVSEDGYAGEVKIRKEERRIGVAVEGTYANDAPNMILEGGVAVDVNGKKVGEVAGHGRFLSGGASLGLDLKTPWLAMEDVHFLGGVNWWIKGSKGPSLKLEISRNKQEFVATAADMSHGTLTGGAFLRTLWTSPASLRYDFDFVSIKEMIGTLRTCYGQCVGINLKVNGTKEIEARLELPTRVLGIEWAWLSESNKLHCSTRLRWEREHSLGFNLRIQTLEWTQVVVEVDLPVRSFKLVAHNGINATSSVSYSSVGFAWDAARDPSKVLSLGLTIARDEDDSDVDARLTISHPALRRDVVLRLTCSVLRLPFSGKLELEYSPDKPDLFVAEVSLERVKIGNFGASRLALVVGMRHQSSGLDIRVGVEGAAGVDKAGGQLGAQYVDARGRRRTIVLTAKVHRVRRSLQLKADTNENSLSVTAGLEEFGLRLETKVNRKPPLTLRVLLDRDMPSALFEADRGRRRYRIYFGSTEPTGSGPITSITARLSRRDVDDDAPPSTIAIAPAVETVLSGTAFSLNSSRILSSRFLWEQRGGLRTPDVPATLGAAFGTMGGWIRDAYSDVGHAWAAVAGEAAAGFLGEGTTHKLRLWYLSIEDEVEGLSTYSRNEVQGLVEDFRSLEDMLTEMYERNDFFIRDIDRFIIYALEQINAATSCVLKALRDTAVEVYVVLRKVASTIVSSASRLVGDAIEVTGSAVSSALPDPAEAARRLGEAAGRVASTARRVGAAARGAARRLADWAEGVVEEARSWVNERRARARQAVWDWAAGEAERMRPVVIVFHSYVLRFKEIVEEVHAIADEISISIAENLANVREIMELGEMVDYYTFKVRNLNWEEASASIKAYLKKTWETVIEDFKSGLGEYRQLVMEKYTELIGRYDRFMQLPPVVEFTGTVKFIHRKAIWTWHYLEIGDHVKRIVSDIVVDMARALAEIVGQITEASRDPNSGSENARDSAVDPHFRGADRSFVLEAGYFEYNVKLPFDWDSFDSVPHFRQMWERPKEAEKTNRAEEASLGQNRPGSTSFTRVRSVLADALLDASSAAAITEATDGEISAAAALAALALPPFPASALVAGDSHLVTFDGRDYSFSAAGCSYLLAGDLTGGTFYLLANYDDLGRRRSVSVLLPPEPHASRSAHNTRGGEPAEERRVDVGMDGRVSVDGRRVELPIEVGSASVGREGERVVVEVGRHSSGNLPHLPAALDTLRSSSPTVVLDCNPFHNVCTVRISGWFFARTAGLLGTYDNEPSNDFEIPDGTVLPKGEEEFVESWRVGNCTGDGGVIGGRNAAGVSHASLAPLPTASEPCDTLFNRESDVLSPLQPCFSRVDPAPYGRLCEVDVVAASNSPSGWETAACASAAAYVAQCRNSGMDLWVPQSCVRCHLSDGSVLSAGETKVYGGEGAEASTPAPLSGDVVFLVEQRPCLRGTQISNLAIKLDNAMRARGLRDNRFALVGFNGGYSSRGKAGGGVMSSRVFGGPHTHTVDGKIWSTKRHFEKAFHNMLFDGREGSGPGGRTTPMEALWYAARLPFRDGVSKTVLLVMCGDCSDATDAAYADAVGMLLEGDLTLHVLAPIVLRTRRQPSNGPIVAVGFDAVGAFTTRNVRSLAPSRDLMRQLAVPKDLCSPLALETNGTRFDVGSVLGGPQSPSPDETPTKAPNLDELRLKRQRKYALDVFVRRVALTGSPSRCQKCDCVADREGVGRVACQRCLFPSMEQFFKEWDSLVYDDDGEQDLEDVSESDRTISTWG